MASAGGPNAPSPEKVFNDFTLHTLAIDQQLLEQFADVLNSTLSDYGKLQGVALFLNQPDVVWPQQAPPVDAKALISLEVALWKLFLPTRWSIVPAQPGGWLPVSHGSAADALVILKGFEHAWPQSGWFLDGSRVPYPSRRGGPQRYRYNAKAWTIGQVVDAWNVNPHILSDSAARLFDVLGVPRADVFGRVNGWSGLQVAQEVSLYKSAFPGGFDPVPVFGEPVGGYPDTGRNRP